jgi:serine/threonine protein kinase
LFVYCQTNPDLLLQVQVLCAYGPVMCGEVALKVSESGAERWLHAEGQALRQLQHENVLSILGFVPCAGPHYMAGGLLLPKCDRSLHDVLAQGRLSDARRWDIARQLLAALVYAHSQGYTHNDLKPGNVLLKGTAVMLADWGIALRIGSKFSGRLGIPGYACPEIPSLYPGELATSCGLHDTWGIGRAMMDLASEYSNKLYFTDKEVEQALVPTATARRAIDANMSVCTILMV